MDEDMELEEEGIPVYQVVEIDFDYEFDAARFFDFTRPESEAESRFSESWFFSAPDYPPSPFIAQLFPLNGLNSPGVDVSPKSRYDDQSEMDDDDDIDHRTEHCDQDEPCREESSQALLQKMYDSRFTNSQKQATHLHDGPPRGLTFFNHLAHDIKKTKTKSLAKPCIRKSSTLMKPTASQLAKQNQQRQVLNSRLQKNEGTSGTACGMESQASKRQKLDGGLLRKITNLKQPINLIHKLPKKDATVQGSNTQTRLRITIPREPDLATAHRAERTRSASSKEMQNSTATRYKFKARPLNKKILETPVFPHPTRNTHQLPDPKAPHFKSSGQTKHHTSTAASTSVCQTDKDLNNVTTDSTTHTGNKDAKRSEFVDAKKGAAQKVSQSFKARPLDRKILTSRGDIGVFRNSKREVTVPKEFEFQTAKRVQQNLPIELFSKLSLTGESRPKNCVQIELPKRTSIPAKGSKENRWEPFHQNCQNMTYQAKEQRATLLVEKRH
ncbi:unnamed protein product [Amaranthus hypochondriacus]